MSSFESGFRRLGRTQWVNLTAAALVTFYLIQIVLDLGWGLTCGHIGIDFCDYWSAGHLANTVGYASVYNPELLGRVERSIFPAFADPSLFITSPFAYLPVFVLPFQLFALLPVSSGYLIWAVLNLVGLIVYLRYFQRSMTTTQETGPRSLLLLLASLPVFLNFFYGQVDVWLLICVGEFLRHASRDRPWWAGAWLGGLMLKPQLLIVIALLLLVRGAFKMLAALAATSAALLAVSLIMLRPGGIVLFLQVWQRFAAGLPSQETESMMNWRMLGQHLSRITASPVGWTLAAAGMLGTLLVAIVIWRRKPKAGTTEWTAAVLAALAASLLVSWHSHVHLALIMLPPMLLLARQKILPAPLLDAWVILPGILFVIVLGPQNLMRLGLLTESTKHLVFFLRGVGEFLACVVVLGWCVVWNGHQGRKE